MAAQCARVWAVLGSTALIATAVGQIVATHHRILLLTAEAQIIERSFRPEKLASYASPLSALSLRVADPRLDAVQMLDMEAVRAAPRRLVVLDLVAAYHALQLVVLDVLDELLALRNGRRINRRRFLVSAVRRGWLFRKRTSVFGNICSFRKLISSIIIAVLLMTLPLIVRGSLRSMVSIPATR